MPQKLDNISANQLMAVVQPQMFEAITTAITNAQLLEEGALLASIEFKLIAKKEGHAAIAVEVKHPVTPEPKKDEYAEKIDAYVAKHAASEKADASVLEVK